jgi:hypothetical protein
MNHCLIGLAAIVKSDSQVVMRHPATGILGEGPGVQSYEVVVNATLLPR